MIDHICVYSYMSNHMCVIIYGVPYGQIICVQSYTVKSYVCNHMCVVKSYTVKSYTVKSYVCNHIRSNHIWSIICVQSYTVTHKICGVMFLDKIVGMLSVLSLEHVMIYFDTIPLWVMRTYTKIRPPVTCYKHYR